MASNPSISWENVNISNSGQSTQTAEDPREDTPSSPSKKKREDRDMGAEFSTGIANPPLPSPPKSQVQPEAQISPPKPRVIFHLIRHGQGTHNDPTLPATTAIRIPDPPLTQVGTSQCHLLREKFPLPPYRSKADLVLCSPLLRTRQTAFIAFSPASPQPQLQGQNQHRTLQTPNQNESGTVQKESDKIILWPSLKELGKGACNTGLPRSRILQELDPDIWNCSLVNEGWEEEFLVGGQEMLRHVQEVRRDLFALAKVLIQGGEWKGLRFERWESTRDVEVVVVSHGNFLSDLVGFDRQRFHNAEWKAVAFPTEEVMKQEGWWKKMTETSLLQVEVEVDGVKVFKGGKVGLVPSRLSLEARKAASDAARKLKEVVVVSEKELVAVGNKLADVE